MYAASELLHAEGLTDVEFVSTGTGPDSSDWMGHDEIDFDWNYPLAHVLNIAKGVPLKVLTGLHVGCLELIASDQVVRILDLKGRKLGVDGSTIQYLLLNVMSSYVGLDPAKDFETLVTPDAVQSLAEGKIDAFLGGPPSPSMARERKLGHVLIGTAIDKPWSQYFCCMLASTADYTERYPVATKRVMRALLKAVGPCVTEPEAIAKGCGRTGIRAVTTTRFRPSVRCTLRQMARIRSRRFDTVLCIAHAGDQGDLDESPGGLARGTDWSFLQEVKRELKT